MTYRTNISSRAQWESFAGYSRAVKIGNIVEVGGTAPPLIDDKVVGINDPYEQAKGCLEIIKAALKAAGCTMKDVIRTRMYVTDISLWEDFAHAHADYFSEVKPVTTMVEVSKLIHPDMLIEIEATAISSCSEL